MKNTQKRFIGFILVMLMLTLSTSSVFAASTTTYPLLKWGSRGTAVVRLQKALVTQGYLRGSADGIYGSLTRSAVIKFQTAKKIQVDGIAGNQTQRLLYAQTTSRATTLSRTTAASTDVYWL